MIEMSSYTPRLGILFITSLLFLLLIPSSSAQITIAVSPGVLDIGKIEPGTSRIARFSLITPSNPENFLVYLRAIRGNSIVFKSSGYKNFLSNYSEEDVSSWVDFISNPVELNQTLENQEPWKGNKIRGARTITFILHVPEDAEPGYHTGFVPLDIEYLGAKRMISINAVAQLTFIFMVPGNAIREGKILSMSSGSYRDSGLNIGVFFKNTGTVTIETEPAKIEILDKRGNVIDTATLNSARIKPGELRSLTGLWHLKDVDYGFYNATVEIGYLTGSAFKESTIEVYKPTVPPSPRVVEEEFVFPWWVLLALIIIIIAVYLFYKS